MNQKHKIVTEIDCPEKWESTNDYNSHRELLWLALENTYGNVVELGSGEGSTFNIRNVCEKEKRQFSSYESNFEWAKKMGSTWVSDWDIPARVLDVWKPCDLLFIDHAPGEHRKTAIEKMKGSSNVLVVHDTEKGAEYVYGMSEILSTFKYRLDYQPIGKPHTTAVSNFIDVSTWI